MSSTGQSAPARLFAAVPRVAILVIAAAVVVAALVGAPWYLLLALAFLLWVLALIVTALRFMASNDRPNKVDSFALREPWRHYVSDAQRAQREAAAAVHQVAPGPIRDHLESVEHRLEDAVDEVWQIANLGQSLGDNRKRINLDDIKAKLADSEDDPNTDSARVSALKSQLESASRIDEKLDATTRRLDTLDARLKETVSRTIELSTAGQEAAAEGLAHTVDHMVDELEAVRQGLEEAG